MNKFMSKVVITIHDVERYNETLQSLITQGLVYCSQDDMTHLKTHSRNIIAVIHGIITCHSSDNQIILQAIEEREFINCDSLHASTLQDRIDAFVTIASLQNKKIVQVKTCKNCEYLYPDGSCGLFNEDSDAYMKCVAGFVEWYNQQNAGKNISIDDLKKIYEAMDDEDK